MCLTTTGCCLNTAMHVLVSSRYRATVEAPPERRRRGNCALIGPTERRIVNSNIIEKVLWPPSLSDRLQDDRIALPANRYRTRFKAAFVRQRHRLTITCLDNFNRFHDSGRI